MFDTDYYREVNSLTCSVFTSGQDIFPGIDIEWFVEYYMKSSLREAVDNSHPRFMCMESARLFDKLKDKMCEDGIGTDYPKSTKTIDNYYGDSILWCAMQYVHMQNRFKISSKTLIEKIPINLMLERDFYTGHQRGFESASDVLYKKYFDKDYEGEASEIPQLYY